MITIPSEISPIITQLHSNNAHPILVGGFVRDSIMGNDCKDLDIEVYGLNDIQSLREILNSFSVTDVVGQSFGVLKLSTANYHLDIALPRTEIKTGPGHRGFEVSHSDTLDFKTAASRRDFTINSIGYDPISESILDPFDGQEDIKNKLLRAIGPAFMEDPLRVFRAMQFAGRFGFDIHPETIELCKQMPLHELPKERIYEEFKKLFLKAEYPSKGLKYLPELGISSRLSPLHTVSENKQYWESLLYSADTLVSLMPDRSFLTIQLMLCLFGIFIYELNNDIGPCQLFLSKLTDERALQPLYLSLIQHYQSIERLYQNQDSNQIDSEIRRLSLNLPFPQLHTLSLAVYSGKSGSSVAIDYPALNWVSLRAKELNVYDSPPSPLVSGKDLQALNVPEGPQIGRLIDAAFQEQLDGNIHTKDDAIQWIKNSLT